MPAWRRARRRSRCIPYFLSPGRHTSHDLPRLVEQAAARHPGVRVRLTAALGPHPKLIDVIVERVSDPS